MENPGKLAPCTNKIKFCQMQMQPVSFHILECIHTLRDTGSHCPWLVAVWSWKSHSEGMNSRKGIHNEFWDTISVQTLIIVPIFFFTCKLTFSCIILWEVHASTLCKWDTSDNHISLLLMLGVQNLNFSI